MLALEHRPVRRLYVASRLWIDSPEDHATACLRTALWRARGPHGALIHASGRMLHLDPSISVDLWEQSRNAQSVLNGQRLPSPEDIKALCATAEVLVDWYEDWVMMSREQFRQMRLHALEDLCGRLSADERFAEAIETGLAAVAAEPLRESAHRALMRAHLSEGNVNEALRQYVFYRGLLRRELDLAPTRAMEQLVRRCVDSDAAVTTGRLASSTAAVR